MLSGSVAGVNAGIAVNSDIRRERQQRLKNYVEGFELNKGTGEYEPNMRGAKALAIQEEELNQKLMAATLQTNIIADKLSADDMTRATSYLLAGRASDANKLLQNNSVLKDRLKKSFNLQSVLPLDIDNDIQQLEEDNGIKIDRTKLQNPVVRKAYQSAFFKAVDNEGKVHIVPTETILKETGYKQYVDSDTHETATERLKRIKEILSGTVKTDEDLAVEHSANQAAIAKNKYVAETMPHKTGADVATYDSNKDVVDAQHKEMVDWFEKNPDKTYSDYQLYIASKAPAKPVDPAKVAKDKLDIQKKQLDVQKKQLELQKYKEEVKSKSKEKQVITDNEFEFVDNLDKIKLTQDSYKKAKDIEAKNIKLGLKPTTDEMKSAANMPKYANRFTKLSKELEKVDRNAWVKVSGDIEKITGVLTSPFKSEKERKKEVRKLLSKWKFDTKLGSAMADYIKFMSGAAVSDEEFKRYVSIIQNGNWSTKEAAASTLNSFAEALTEKAKDSLEGIKYKAPYSYLTYKRQLNSGSVARNASKHRTNTQPKQQQVENKQTKVDNRPPLDKFKRM